MRRIAPHLIVALCSLYAVAIGAWQALRLLCGDCRWWLTAANTFSPHLFWPLVALIPLALLSRRRMARIAVAAPTLVLVLLYGELFLPRLRPVDRTQGPQLRVMTLNVFYINDDGAAVERLVEAESPDVIFFQELTPRIAADLEARLGDSHPYRLLFPAEGTTGIGFFSRFPLHGGGLLPDPAEEAGWWRQGALTTTLDFRGQPVVLLNVHAVPPPSDFFGSGWRSHFEAITHLREQELALWMGWVADQKEPLIAAGDFNLGDQNAGYRLVAAHLHDAYRQAGWGWGHTWQAYASRFAGLPLFKRIVRLDYIWYSDRWEVVEAHVAPWDGQSDHLAVVATLLLGNFAGR